jgi:hypothetical protein
MEELKELHPEINENDMTAAPLPSDESATEEDNFIPNTPLPAEIAVLIFSFLDLKSLCISSLVSKHWSLLANDKLLWKERLEQYSQGHLWRYLFKTPDKSAYQSYFTEVFFLPNFNSDNFFELIKHTKDNLIKTIIFTRVCERRARFDKYFEQVNIIETNNLLSELINSIQELSNEVRSQFLTHKFDSILVEQNFKKLVITLHQIESLEAILMNQLCLFKLVFFDPTKLWELISPSVAFLKPNTIIAIMACVGEKIILNNSVLGSLLLRKLNCDELLECVACSGNIAEFILRQPNLINNLCDDDLAKVFSSVNNIDLNKSIFDIVINNRLLLRRLNINLLFQLGGDIPPNFQLIYFIHIYFELLTNKSAKEEYIQALSKRGIELPDFENGAISDIKANSAKKKVRFSIPQNPELRTARKKIPPNQIYQSSYATTACQLDTHPLEKQSSRQAISKPRLLSTVSNWSPTQRHQVKETARQSNNSILWSAAGLLGIGLLLATGILLCATGGGALAGVPFIVSAVAFLPVSIEIVGAVCLVAGTFLSLIGLNLANEHSTKLIKPIITSAKESFKKSLAEPVPSFFTPYKKYKPVFEPVAKLPLKPASNKIIYSDENFEDKNCSSSHFSNR